MAKVANAIALNEPLSLTQMAVGDGNGNPVTPNASQTTLVREKYRAAINSLEIDTQNPANVIAEMVVPTTVGGWTAREVGVFDVDGNLICIANLPETYKPVLAEGSSRDLVIRILMEVTNTDAVTLVASAAAIATRQWVVDNFGLANLLPGGSTGNILSKASNADGDTEWIDPASGLTFLTDMRTEMQTLAAGQTTVDLATNTTAGMALYIEGAREFDFTVNSTTQFTLSSSYPAGTRIWMVQNDPTADLSPEQIGSLRVINNAGEFASLSIASGVVVQTECFASKHDKGGALYLIQTPDEAPQAVDGMKYIALANGNKAVLLPVEGVTYAEQWGATSYRAPTLVKTALNAALASATEVRLLSGLLVDGSISVPVDSRLVGDSSKAALSSPGGSTFDLVRMDGNRTKIAGLQLVLQQNQIGLKIGQSAAVTDVVVEDLVLTGSTGSTGIQSVNGSRATFKNIIGDNGAQLFAQTGAGTSDFENIRANNPTASGNAGGINIAGGRANFRDLIMTGNCLAIASAKVVLNESNISASSPEASVVISGASSVVDIQNTKLSAGTLCGIKIEAGDSVSVLNCDFSSISSSHSSPAIRVTSDSSCDIYVQDQSTSVAHRPFEWWNGSAWASKSMGNNRDVIVDRPIAFSAHRTTAQNFTVQGVPGSTIVFDAEIMDIGGAYNNTTGAFTAPRNGMYEFHASASVDVGASPPTQVELSIRTTLRDYVLDRMTDLNANQDLIMNGSVLLYLAAGETASACLGYLGGTGVSTGSYNSSVPANITTHFSGRKAY
jgi:hypothetical protein